MLDRDPHADQPPDLSILRPRSRSHRTKSSAKKQPQRGLGVAQLEKLRLEEQNKQHEAACLASLQQQQRKRYIHFQQREQAPYLHNRNLLHHQGQTLAFCASRKIKHMELPYMKPGLAEPCITLPSAKLNVAHSSFPPLATMESRCQTTSFSLQSPHQLLLPEDEASTSLTSQMHDICSPATPPIRPSSAESRLSPILTRTSTASLVERSWLNHLYDREPSTERVLPLSDLCYARSPDNSIGMYRQDQTSEANGVKAALTELREKSERRHLSMGKLYVRNEGCAVPFTDSILRSSRSDRVLDGAHTSQITHLDSPTIASTAGEKQMKELSSFQTMSSCPSWSNVDKVFNRKRSWACTQEVSRPVASLKGMDLNTSANDMESEVTEQGPKITVPFTIRDGWNPFLRPCVEKCNDDKLKALVSDTSWSLCDSPKSVERPFMDACAHKISFMTLQKRIANTEIWAVETPGEFLTLGPSSSLLQKTRNGPPGSGICGTHPVLKTLEKEGINWYSQGSLLEQVGALLQACSSDESLDLELRLSI